MLTDFDGFVKVSDTPCFRKVSGLGLGSTAKSESSSADLSTRSSTKCTRVLCA